MTPAPKTSRDLDDPILTVLQEANEKTIRIIKITLDFIIGWFLYFMNSNVACSTNKKNTRKRVFLDYFKNNDCQLPTKRSSVSICVPQTLQVRNSSLV